MHELLPVHSQAIAASFPGHCSLIPRPLQPHSQAIAASFPGHCSLIPRPLQPHPQAIAASFPGHCSLIPRPLQPHSQTIAASFPGHCSLIPRIHSAALFTDLQVTKLRWRPGNKAMTFRRFDFLRRLHTLQFLLSLMLSLSSFFSLTLSRVLSMLSDWGRDSIERGSQETQYSVPFVLDDTPKNTAGF